VVETAPCAFGRYEGLVMGGVFLWVRRRTCLFYIFSSLGFKGLNFKEENFRLRLLKMSSSSTAGLDMVGPPARATHWLGAVRS
jgi:hypothetical protein